MMYVRFPLSLRNVVDLLHELGIEISHETLRFGGTGLARCSPQKFGNGGFRGGARAVGAGIWMRCL